MGPIQPLSSMGIGVYFLGNKEFREEWKRSVELIM